MTYDIWLCILSLILAPRIAQYMVSLWLFIPFCPWARVEAALKAKFNWREIRGDGVFGPGTHGVGCRVALGGAWVKLLPFLLSL
jgi:hypothetical protein